MEVIILINKQKQEPLSQTNIGESTKRNGSTIPGCGAPKETCTENSSEGRVGGWGRCSVVGLSIGGVTNLG